MVSRNTAWKAASALIAGVIMALFGLFVFGEGGYRLLNPDIPQFETIGFIGLLALAANTVCLLLLWKHRAEDTNMRSVWLCSRNDILANMLVLVAAIGVWMTRSHWPDLLVGLRIAAISSVPLSMSSRMHGGRMLRIPSIGPCGSSKQTRQERTGTSEQAAIRFRIITRMVWHTGSGDARHTGMHVKAKTECH